MPRKSYVSPYLAQLKYPYTLKDKQERLQKKWDTVEILFNNPKPDTQSECSTDSFTKYEIEKERKKEENANKRQEKRKYLNFLRKKDDESKVLMIIPKNPIKKPKTHVTLDKARLHRLLDGGLEVNLPESKVRQVSVAPLYKATTPTNFSQKQTVIPEVQRNGSAVANGKLPRRESIKAELERRKSLVSAADKHRRRASILAADKSLSKEDSKIIGPDSVLKLTTRKGEETNSPRSVKSLKFINAQKFDRTESNGSIFDLQQIAESSQVRTKSDSGKVKTYVGELSPVRTKSGTGQVQTSAVEPITDGNNTSTSDNSKKVSFINQSVAYYLINGQVKMNPNEERRRHRRRRQQAVSDAAAKGTEPKEANETVAKNHPVKALDISLDRIDRFIKVNLKEDELLYRQKLMPKWFEKNESLRQKCHTLQQALKVQELLECLRENKKTKSMKQNRVSPDGASCPDTECDCDCHHKENLRKGKGKGKGKSSKPKTKCELGKDSIMACCCGKKLPKTSEVIVITPEPEVVEPEIVIETSDVEIQVDVEELKSNVSEVKPKRPRFVSVYLEAPDENTPRYMLAKNIHHKDRTQYTYIENKRHTDGEHWETTVNNKHTTDHSLGSSSGNDPHVTSASKIIQVKESDSAHDFSDCDALSDYSPVHISVDCIHNDGSKWNRGVDTESLIKDDPVIQVVPSPLPEQGSPQDLHSHELSTNDSGIETIDLDSVSEAETQHPPSGKLEIKRPVYVKPEVVYDSGTPGAISKVHHIPVTYVKGEPTVPKNRGTIIDYSKRLKEITRIYDPFNIDLDKVKLNNNGELVYMRGSKSRSISRETSQTRSEMLDTSTAVRNSPILENDISEDAQTVDDSEDAQTVDDPLKTNELEETRPDSARTIVASPGNLTDKQVTEAVSPTNTDDLQSRDSDIIMPGKNSDKPDNDLGQHDNVDVLTTQTSEKTPSEPQVSDDSGTKGVVSYLETPKVGNDATDVIQHPVSHPETELKESNQELTTNNLIPSNRQAILV